MLAGQGWSAPVGHSLQCKTTIDLIAKAPWINEMQPDPDFSLFPWSRLRIAERNRLLSQQDKYPAVLSPFHEEERQEPCNKPRRKMISLTVPHGFAVNLVHPAITHLHFGATADHELTLGLRLAATSSQSALASAQCSESCAPNHRCSAVSRCRPVVTNVISAPAGRGA